MGKLIDEIKNQSIAGNTPIEDISELIPDYLGPADAVLTGHGNRNKTAIK